MAALLVSYQKISSYCHALQSYCCLLYFILDAFPTAASDNDEVTSYKRFKEKYNKWKTNKLVQGVLNESYWIVLMDP